MDDHVFHCEVWIDLDVEENTLHSCEGRTLKVLKLLFTFYQPVHGKSLGSKYLIRYVLLVTFWLHWRVET
jgi:hypothetical protein